MYPFTCKKTTTKLCSKSQHFMQQIPPKADLHSRRRSKLVNNESLRGTSLESRWGENLKLFARVTSSSPSPANGEVTPMASSSMAWGREGAVEGVGRSRLQARCRVHSVSSEGGGGGVGRTRHRPRRRMPPVSLRARWRHCLHALSNGWRGSTLLVWDDAQGRTWMIMCRMMYTSAWVRPSEGAPHRKNRQIDQALGGCS
jgi:hypothetical protein